MLPARRVFRTFAAVLALTLGLSAAAGAQVLDGPDPAQMEDAPDLGYRPVPHGLQIPDNLEMGAPSSVGWTSMNRILVFNRGPNPLMEFEPDGTFVRSWGQGQYDRPHGMRIDSEGHIWTTDVNADTVRKMNPEGEVLMTITPDDTPLMNEPTDLAIGLEGEIFVLVGHGQGEPHVLKFDREGELLRSWGEQGTGPSQFDTPHSVVIDTEGMVYVADRQNRRIQIFDREGNYVKEWAYKGLPCGLYIHSDGTMYMVSGFAGEILQLDENGRAVGANGQPGRGLGEFGEAHYMTLAPNGDIWVADTVRPELHKYVKQ